jgi:hypothetical protein
MKWLKKGVIIEPSAELIPKWGKKRLMLPTPVKLDEQTIRIFTGFCDDNQVGRIGYVDVDINLPSKIKNISSSPMVEVGKDGTFDDNGVVPTSIVFQNNCVHLYYAGYQNGAKIKYYIFDGLATSDSLTHNFNKYSQTPVLDRKKDETYFRTGSFVIKDGDIWKMWYIGGGDWTENQEKKVPIYN